MASRRKSYAVLSALALLAAPLKDLLANGGNKAAGPFAATSGPAGVIVAAVTEMKPAQDPKGGKSERKIDVEKLTADSAAVSEKLYQFIWNGGYLSDSARAEKNAETRWKAVVKKWVDEKLKDTTSKASVAELVYVLDLDKDHEKKRFLLNSMKVWTKDPEAGKQNPGVFLPGQFQGTQPDKWPEEFLTYGTIHARKALDENRAPETIAVDIGRIEERPPVAVSPDGKDRDPLAVESDAYRMYEKGAEVLNVFKEGDKTARKISIKMSTRKEADGTLVDELRIYDLTKPSDLFYQSIDITRQGGESTFALDDRQPGMRKYTLTMTPESSGDMTIKFGREGSKGEGTIITSFAGLMRLRALQALSEGRVKNINGEDYYVLDQGGESVDKMYFPSTIKQDLSAPESQARKLRPSNMAEVAAVVNGRYVVHTEKKPDLGKFGGQPYHLEWVAVNDRNSKDYPGYFKVAEGPGDRPTTPPPGGSTTTTPSPNPNPNPNNPDLEDQFIRAGYYALNQKAYEGAPAGMLRILSATEKGKKWLAETYPDTAFSKQHIVVIPEVKRIVNVAFVPKPNGTFTAQEMSILAQKFLVTVSDGGTLYMELGKHDQDVKRGFLEVGGVMTDEMKTVSKLTNKAILPHALNVAGFDVKQIETAMKNLETVLKGATIYSINGSKPTSLVVVVGADGKPTQFWPEIKDGTPSDGSHTDTKTGNAYDAYKGAGPLDEKFPEAPTLDGMKLAKIKDVSDAVIYVNEVPAASATKDKPRRYYMLVGFNNKDQKMRTAFMNVFNVGDGTLEPPAGDKFDIAGLLHVKFDGDLMTSGMEPRVVSPQKKDPTKGLYGMFATRASAKANTKDPATNCLGPVVWWGMTKEQAAEACKKNSL